SGNLANINTTRTIEGGPYRRRDVVFAPASVLTTFRDIFQSEIANKILGVRIVDIVNDKREPRLVYDPNHPDANELGYVALPNINLIEEMVNMLSATRSYEANVTAINASKGMALRALEIGK
ncbi:MAG: flagellar basal body rod protein FlgC, partial [Nitrospinae bacterium]|nr:flagellar basal body rod protein FlgC [Nitrospinota bacterium]